jgi:hypothetical protein
MLNPKEQYKKSTANCFFPIEIKQGIYKYRELMVLLVQWSNIVDLGAVFNQKQLSRQFVDNYTRGTILFPLYKIFCWISFQGEGNYYACTGMQVLMDIN